MFPNDARLRNMTYGTTIHYDVDIEFHYSVFNGDIEERKIATNTFNQIFLGRLPIMLQSNLCILHSLDRAVRFQMGECKNDYGGYFIIDGKEKLIVSQEKFADNLIYCRKYNNPETDVYLVTADIRSVSEDTSKFTRTTSVRLVAPETKYTNLQLVVLVPNIKQPVPLFILMRALGIESDQDIIQTCLLIDVALDPDNMYIDLFIPSIHHAGLIFTQQTALAYLAELTKRKTTTEVMEILSDYFLPHIGELTFQEKAFFIGHMVNRVLRVYTKDEMPTDRDNFIFKRAETSGALLCDLFREYYLIQKKEILRKIGTELLVHGGDIMDTNELSEDALLSTFNLVIVSNRNAFFKERSLEIGMHKGFKGNWGSEAYTKRIGVVQDMNRLSWFTAMSHLRKMDLQMDASAKVVGPRLLNSSQWGIIDPVDTPDGGNIGLHKHLAICTYVTCRSPTAPVVQWLKTNTAMKGIENCSAVQLGALTKIMVNGKWVGVIDLPIDMVNFIKEQRRIGVFPVYASVAYHNRLNEISICTDAGRLTRPIYYMKKPLVPSYQMINNKTDKDVLWTWEQLITGFTEKKKTTDGFSSKHNRVYNSPTDLYNPPL
jgi:DNA-directed RNA polymerase II subunit RPB2